MCALQTDRGIYCVCIKCAFVNDISSLVGPVLPIWRLSEFRVMECQSWKLDACGKGRFYRGPAVPLSSDTHTNTHAAKCHAQICTQPHTLSGHSACTRRGPHAHDPLPRFMYFICVWSEKASEMTGNYYLANLPRNRIKQQWRPSESWIQTVRSGSVYLLIHHVEPH